ncbi:MAG: hypothetical protein IKT35_03375 [Clostridia bacterium]|nr:hypothetical protein [Clostridia bacterium]
MKKIICILMCVALLGCLFGCGGEDTKTSEYIPPVQNEFFGKDATGAVGDTVEVIFELGKDTPIAAADFIFEYDSSTLQYVETNQIYKFQSGYVMGNSPEAGKAKVALVTLDPARDGGDLFSVNFKILKECKDGSEIKVSTSSCCDENYKKIDLVCKGAKVFSK